MGGWGGNPEEEDKEEETMVASRQSSIASRRSSFGSRPDDGRGWFDVGGGGVRGRDTDRDGAREDGDAERAWGESKRREYGETRRDVAVFTQTCAHVPHGHLSGSTIFPHFLLPFLLFFLFSFHCIPPARCRILFTLHVDCFLPRPSFLPAACPIDTRAASCRDPSSARCIRSQKGGIRV